MKRILPLFLFLLFSCGLAESLSSPLLQKMEDFTVQCITGQDWSLHDALSEKKGVMIYLFATSSYSCFEDFPRVEEAYLDYSGEIEVLALSVDPEDDDSLLSDYAKGLSLSFSLAGTSALTRESGVSKESLPMQLFIDRFGMIIFSHNGPIPSAGIYRSLFDHLIDENYTESYPLLSLPPEKIPYSPFPEDTVAAALNLEDPCIRILQEEDYYPFLPSDTSEFPGIAASNTGADSTEAQILFRIEAESPGAFSVNYELVSESPGDFLVFGLDGVRKKALSGSRSGSYSIPLSEGTHTISVAYRKDAENSVSVETARILGVSFLTGDTAASSLAGNPSFPFSDYRISIANGTPLTLSDPDGLLKTYYGDTPLFSIVSSDSAQIIVTVPEETDPDCSFFYDFMTNQYRCLADLKWGDHFIYTSSLHTEDSDESGYSLIVFIRDYLSMDLSYIILFPDQESADFYAEQVSREFGYPAAWLEQ